VDALHGVQKRGEEEKNKKILTKINAASAVRRQ
jgi:hypothetical protein